MKKKSVKWQPYTQFEDDALMGLLLGKYLMLILEHSEINWIKIIYAHELQIFVFFVNVRTCTKCIYAIPHLKGIIKNLSLNLLNICFLSVAFVHIEIAMRWDETSWYKLPMPVNDNIYLTKKNKRDKNNQNDNQQQPQLCKCPNTKITPNCS